MPDRQASALPIHPGQALKLSPATMEFVGSASDVSGVLVDARGRIAFVISGAGVRASFADPDQLAALGAMLIAAADDMRMRAVAAMGEAAGDLARVSEDFATRARANDGA